MDEQQVMTALLHMNFQEMVKFCTENELKNPELKIQTKDSKTDTFYQLVFKRISKTQYEKV